uniref:Uncharacterized protein n=1 Tax=Acrobeloides nanus TaxID=290746 RepID=A0A914D1Y3_9BILA
MLTSLRNIEWKNLSLGKEFIGPRLDGLVKVLFEYDSEKDELIERHRLLDNIDAKPDFLKYYRVGDYLVMQLEYDGVVAVRLFKKSV